MADARNEFNAAVQAVKKAPDDFDSWDAVESLAETLNCPDEVAGLYKEILAGDLSRDLATSIGERAAAFLEEWFGDDPTILRGLLIRVLELDSSAEWAFQRLTEIFTVSESWRELLDLYDRALQVTRDDDRRIQLLDEAAQVAKDIANLPDKAISYLQQLVPLKPDDSQLEHSLERLLERHERWVDLIGLWQSKLPGLTPEERDQSRVRIATCWLDNLSEPGKALEAVRPLLAEGKDEGAACQLLERIVTYQSASTPVRHSALDMLRLHYEATERPREIVRVLEAAIAMASPQESQPLRQEAGDRLAALDEDIAAMNHYSALLALNPGLTMIQDRMLELARRSGEFRRYAEGIAVAAQACEIIPRTVALLAEAARVRLDMLDDEAGAIELYKAALAQEGLPAEEEPRVARRLAELLARADRQAERLDVLERLASIETTPSNRRTVIGEAARLAESLGATDRALKLWQGRIDSDGDDLFALDAMIALLESEKRWQPLIESLGLRVSKATSDSQRRADLVRIATIFDRELGALPEAIDAWLRVQSECGESAETVDALADLLTRTERWSDVAELLERASGKEIARVSERLVRLSDAYRQHLGAPERALSGYRSALALDSLHEQALAGLTGLLAIEECSGGAAIALAQAHRKNEDWPRFLELLEPQLAHTSDPRQRLVLLREAADIQENKVDDPARALTSLARAFPLAPKDQVLESNLGRLAGVTGSWGTAAQAYREAAGALMDDPHEVARLRCEHGKILELRLACAEEAHDAFFMVLGIEPGNLAAVQAVVRLGSRLGRWEEVATALLSYIRTRNQVEPTLLEEMESVAAKTGAFDSAAAAIWSVLERSPDLSPRLAFELYRTLALWNRDRRNDRAGAVAALERALGFEPGHAEALRDLAALLRDQPGRSLFDTLRRLSDAEPNDLDVQKEAAEVALEHLGDAQDDIHASLSMLLGRATAAWRGTSQASGQSSPDTYVSWALDRLVVHHVAAGHPSAAVDLLVDGSRLPFDGETRRAMRHRAAEIAADKLGDRAVAIEMYRSVLSQAPDDTVAMHKLAALYDAEGRVAEKLSLRSIQLGSEKEAAQRLALRLEIAHLVGEIERRGGRMEALHANLEEEPGHGPSIEALYNLLSANGAYAELASLLEAQARKLEEQGAHQAASVLWSRAAGVAEEHTKEVERAIAGYRRVVELAPTPAALHSLARLYVERGQPAMAVPWLENLLATAPRAERPTIVFDLAKAHLGAQHIDRAITCLESYINDREPTPELRTLLAELYRQSESYEPLARLLTSSLPTLKDRNSVIAYAREAADIYSRILGSPNKAIPALEKALALMPDDRVMRTQLAVGLRVAGRYTESRDILTEIIEEFGRRRSPERAMVHVELALVQKALDDDEQALAQMELASKMDVGNVEIQRRLAELARQAGKLDKAERTYRALLLVVRRKPPGDDIESVGVSEVLYELHKLAEQRGEDEQAKELLESALETAVQNDVEVRRLRRSLLAHNEADTLLRVLRMRLEAAETSQSKADLLADIALVLDQSLNRSEEAMEAVLEATRLQPVRQDLHATGRALSKRTGKVKQYAEAMIVIAENLRRKEDPPIVAQLLMRAGEALEQEVGDLEGAMDLFKRVEELGERTAEAFYAISRVAGALGNTAEQARVLESMLALATSGEPSQPAQIDALYSLAEIFVRARERRGQGIELLEQAFAAEPRYVQAGAILKVAAEAEPDSATVMTLYERVARAGGSWEMLLDFLERRASRPEAIPQQIREAVGVAMEHEQYERAEALLNRAVAAARDTSEGITGAVWAVVGLAEQRMATGELHAARDLIAEIATFADAQTVRRLALDLAARSTRREPELAAAMYESVRQVDPSDRQVWEPLVNLYRDLGDSERLQGVISGTLPTLVDPAERNALRMQHAHYLIDRLQRNREAIEILRDVLLDDPDHLDAGALLEEVLRKEGDQEGLADFLWQRFDEARERGNPDTVIDVANRLGGLLDSMGSGEALGVYRAALEVAPRSRQLLDAVLAHLGPDGDPRDRAHILERLLEVEEPGQVAQLAMELSGIWESLGDTDGVLRTLEIGHRANPDDAGLHQRLESFYRDNQQWARLAELMTGDAEHLATGDRGPDAAVARLREAAAVYRDMLGDTRAAAAVLRRARALAPKNDHLVAELAACLSAGGDVRGAVDAIGEGLGSIEGAPRIDLLLLRSDLRAQLGEDRSAVDDLEDAYRLDPARIRPQLMSVLEAQRSAAEDKDDRYAERAVTMRLIAMLGEAGDDDSRRTLLVHWIEREPSDREPLYILRDMDKAVENWEGVLSVCARMVGLETGDAQIQAALGLAEAAELAGRPGDAQPGLEMVHAAQPQDERVRTRLRHIYELAGAHHELAMVLLADGEHATDPEARYGAYRKAAEILIYSLRDTSAALEPAKKALDLKPEDHDAVILYVDALMVGGRTDEAINVLEPAIANHKRRSPQLAALQQRMARVASVLGDHEGQIGWLKKAFDVDRKNGEIAAELAQMATEMGDYDLALKPLRAITLMDNPGPISRVMALLWEAKIEHARGNRAKAELWAKKALREDPNYADAQQFLDQIATE